jgi:glycosyl hydrolase family 97
MIQVLALSIVLALFSLATVAPAVNAQDISADQLSTPWTAQIDRAAPWSEYPRPQLQRDGWINLNGAWDYAVRPREMTTPPETFDGKILVPFPIESHLSGVQRRVGANERLWYHRSFTGTELSDGKRLLLHFGAVDWQTEVAMARRSGTEWFIAVINGGEATSLDIPLGFLGDGNWKATRLYDTKDKSDAWDRQDRATTKADLIQLNLSPRGGFVAWLRK